MIKTIIKYSLLFSIVLSSNVMARDILQPREDLDSDNDGISDLYDRDIGNDGIVDGSYGSDMDNDGISDRWDTDADNDGTSDDWQY